MRKLRLTAFAVIFCFVLTTVSSFGCTGMYVGKDVSENGRTIIARSEDQSGGAYGKMFKVQKAENKKGRYFVDTGEGQDNFKVPLPKKTYKYTYIPDTSELGDGMYPAACNNEYGVSVVGTISAEASEEYLKVDPLVKRGLREAILPGLIACQVKSAKEAVDVTAKLVDKYGSQEGNILFFADHKEAWIMEIYGGHNYCAMKMPKDKVAVFGNQFMIGTVDPNAKKDYVYSKNLFKDVEKVGAVKEDGKINLVKSISRGREEYSNMRTWAGEKLFAPSIAGEYNNDKYYPLFFKPDKKVSLENVFDAYRYRYEGTPYDMAKSDNIKRRPICICRSSDVHVMEILNDMPKDSSVVQWLCMGSADHSVFVPSFSGITDTYKDYQVDNSGLKYDPESAYWQFKRISTLVKTDTAYLDKSVKDVFKLQEKMEIDKIEKSMKTVSKKYKESQSEGRKYVTDLGKEMAKEQLINADLMFKSLMYVATNNINDSDDLSKKIPFVAPIDIKAYAEYKGYKYKAGKADKDNVFTFTLKKGDKSYKFKIDSDKYEVSKGKKKTKEKMAFAPYEKGKTVYVPYDIVNVIK